MGGHHHSHDHPEKSRGQQWKYIILIVLISAFFLVELGVSIYAGSLALQTDAVHMLADLLALTIGLISYRLTLRKKTTNFTYGWTRAEIIGGLVNSVFLLAICFSVFLEIIHKISELVENGGQNPDLLKEIDLVLIVAGLGLGVNIIGMILFYQEHATSQKAMHEAIEIEASELSELENELEHMEQGELNKTQSSETNESGPPGPQITITNLDGQLISGDLDLKDMPKQDSIHQFHVDGHKHHRHHHKDLNRYAVFLHILGDTLGSVAVVGSSLAIKYLSWPGRFYLDPLVSLMIMIVIGIGSFRLMKQCVMILLHQSPVEIDSELLLTDIRKVAGIVKIHEFHLWSLNNRVKIASLHVQLTEESMGFSDIVLGKIKEVLHKHGVHVSTIQPEWDDECIDPRCSGSEEGHNCDESRCCSSKEEKN